MTEHSRRWSLDATNAELAEVALAADELLAEHSDLPPDSAEIVRDTRRIALDELVRRGAIESYSFV